MNLMCSLKRSEADVAPLALRCLARLTTIAKRAKLIADDFFDDWYSRDVIFRVTDTRSGPPAPVDFPGPILVLAGDADAVPRHEDASRARVTGNLRVRYSVDPSPKPFMIMFSRNQRVADFVGLIRAKQKRDDLCFLHCDEMLLDNDDFFDDWYSRDVIFHLDRPSM
jgi:hypothetical protein